MITNEELNEVVDNLQATPISNTLLVLVPKISEKTETGIIKGDALMKEEEGKTESFLTVVAKADDVEVDINVGDRVFIQGNIITFNEDAIPQELDVAPDGYTIGLVLSIYVKMKI